MSNKLEASKWIGTLLNKDLFIYNKIDRYLTKNK
jgi:hypothetical protein